MNNITKLSLKLVHKTFAKIHNSDTFGYTQNLVQVQGQEASDLIKSGINGTRPFMVCRFGNNELNTLLNHYFINLNQNILSKSLNYIRGKSLPFWWDESGLKYMESNAGFIGANTVSIEKFCELMIEDIRQVDILGSWMKGESYFDHLMPHSIKIPLSDLEPFKHENPWSEALEHKRVLVIHPYESSIQQQYSIRHLLFKDKRVLPSFELKTIKAVQSIANNKTSFKDWFEALNAMKAKINNTEFDVAIIGCGAYGFPLAAHVKRLGKKAIHLGGSTQILFGIKGKRWENSYMDKYFNENWKSPLPEETPKNSDKIENGCYW